MFTLFALVLLLVALIASLSAIDGPALREEYSGHHTAARTILDKCQSESRPPTAQEQSALDTNYARMEAIKNEFDEQERYARRALESGNVDFGHEPKGKAEYDASEGRVHLGGDGSGSYEIDAARAEFARSLNRWGSTGQMDRRFATVTTATATGALLPKSILGPVVPAAPNAFREGMMLAGFKPVETSGAEDLTLPILDASAGGTVSETAAADTDSPPDLTNSIRLTAKTYQSGSAWFSNLQLTAAGFDLTSYVLESLMYSKELGLESAIAAAMIADAGITQVVTLGGATAGDLVYAKLADLNRALPKRYDRSKAIILSGAAYATAEKLVDTTGQPIMVRNDPQNLELLRFNGTPVVRSDYLEAFGAAKVIGMVVSFLGFKIRDVTTQNLARYVQVPTRPNQTGFNLFAYHGYGYAPAAVAKLKTA